MTFTSGKTVLLVAGVLALPVIGWGTPVGATPVVSANPLCEAATPPTSACMTTDSGLGTRQVLGGLAQPIGVAFPTRTDMLVIEKATGKVRHFREGAQVAEALDLAVNSSSERGLLGITLHPKMGKQDCTRPPTPMRCSVYLYYTESSQLGADGKPVDSAGLSQVPLLGNRVDRFLWDGARLTKHSDIVRLRAYQKDYNARVTTAYAAPTQAPALTTGAVTLPADVHTVAYTLYSGTPALNAAATDETRLSPASTIQTDGRAGISLRVQQPLPSAAGTVPTGIRVYLQRGTDPAGKPEYLRVAQVPFAAGADPAAPPSARADVVLPVAAAQAPPPYFLRGNHNGGTIKTSPGGKLYVFIGDVGRRGAMQNFPAGPATPGSPNAICAEHGLAPTCDDQFGGPLPDDAHLTGVVLRLNDDGSAPDDNPLVPASGGYTGQVRENLKKVWAYGVRNGIGLAVDPRGHKLWGQENGDDVFSEINLLAAGTNGGWTQIAGPVDRVAQYKANEIAGPTPAAANSLQQSRWVPRSIADSPDEALARLFQPTGSQYRDPKLAWTWEIAPGGLDFAARPLGKQYDGDLFVGAASPALNGGSLMRLDVGGEDRDQLVFTDPRLRDGVADNLAKHDATESESLIVGKAFGITPDVHTGPDGTLYVVSLTRGAVFQVFPR